jgi:hypothetical protein
MGATPLGMGCGLTGLLKAAIDRLDWYAVEQLMAKIKNSDAQKPAP